jgi:hypothetical protein
VDVENGALTIIGMRGAPHGAFVAKRREGGVVRRVVEERHAGARAPRAGPRAAADSNRAPDRAERWRRPFYHRVHNPTAKQATSSNQAIVIARARPWGA